MLDKHDPSVLGFDEIKDLLNLLAAVAQSILHHLSSNMSLLVGEQNHTGALNISAFQRFHSPRKTVVENTKADDTSLVSISHVSPLVLGAAAQGASVPLIFGQDCILIIKYDNAPPAYLAFQINGGYDLRGVDQSYPLASNLFLEVFPYWVCGSSRAEYPNRGAVLKVGLQNFTNNRGLSARGWSNGASV